MEGGEGWEGRGVNVSLPVGLDEVHWAALHILPALLFPSYAIKAC